MARAMSNSAVKGSRAVLVEGGRIPFMLSGTAYNEYIAQDLARMALKGLLTRTALDTSTVDYVILGTVIQEGTCSGCPGDSAHAP